MDVVQTAVVATANLLVPGSGVVVNGAIELAKILFQIGQVLNGMEENASLIKSQRSIMEKDVWRFRWLVEVLEQRVQNKELFTKELQKLIAKFETEIREYDRMAKTFLRQKVLKQLVFCKKFEATSTNVREIAENLEKCLQLECSISAAHTSAQDRNKQYMMLVDSPEVQSELSDPEVQKELLAIITVRGLRSEATQQTCDANVRVLSVIHDKLWARSSHTIREEVNNLPDWFMTEDDVDIDTSTVIGSGGDAKISKGVLRDGTSVAVKIFTESGKMSDAAKQKFISTIDLWKRMNDNDNICRLYGACYLTATPFIVMEYYDNGPLDQFLRQHEGDRCRHSLEILAQAAKAITKMHSMGIVHGDLKCDNILVSDSIQAKVSDFDRSFDWTAKKVKRLVNGKAADAGVEITDAVRHVAPECVKGMLPSSKSDVYSFGMTLYQALVGKAPYFDITSHEEVRECKLGGELPSRVAQLISDDAWALITQCCDPESDKRPTMEEVTVQLKSLLAQHVAGNPVHIVGCADDGSNHLAVSGIEMLVSQSVDAKGVEATSNRLHVFPSEAQSSTDGTPVKPSKSGSRSIPRLYKIIGAVVFVVVVGGIVGLIVGLGSSAGTHDSSSSTGSYWPSSSAGSDSNSGSSWSSSSASSSSASDVLGMGVSDLTILGPGSSPSLTHKGGMAVAANGVIYLSDGTRILRMTEGSKPTVYAGSADETGDADGARLEATFSSLGALAVSSSDDLFVCDGDKVRKITDNTVSTLYTAQSYPYFEGIALDSSENVYVTEFNNGIITRITSKGVSTFSNKLSTPEGIAIDALDNIYVTNNYQVVAFTSSGTMSVLAEYQSDESGLFRYPGSLAVGSDGDLYVADTKSYCIGKIGVTTKKVTLYAGTCTSTGGSNGAASSATFQRIWAIAAAADNVFYERDSVSASDQYVRKIYPSSLSSSTSSSSVSDASVVGENVATILDSDTSSVLTNEGGMAVTSDGVIYLGDGSRILQMTEDTEPTLYAGSAGESGAVNGALLVARFSSLGAFAVSSSGDLFVCDDDKVRKISGDTVSTVYTAPSSSNLKGIAVDSSGNAYVTEYNNGLITKITSKGVSVFTSQSNANGIAIDSSDNIYVSHNQQVVAFTPDGTMSIVAGNEYWTSGYADGNFTSARFRYPGPLAIGSDGNLYVADTGNYCIRKVSLTTKEVTSYAGTGVADGVAAESSFQKIWAIAALADNVFYERDSMSGSDQRVRKIYGLSSSSSASSGSSATSGVSSSSGPVSVLVSSGTYLTMDGGIAMASNGVIYLSDGSRILKMTEGSAPVLYAGKAGDDGDADGARLDARFLSENVGALALSSSGDLFICDYYKVRKISGNTVSTLYSGTSGLSYRGIAVDSSGNVFITDYYNGKITKITSKGVASTFSTSLSNPSGIVIDSADNIYVTDNNRVIKFTSGGAMTVLAGTTSSGLVDGTGTSARFNTPDSLAIGSDGDLFIADRVNYCIRRLNLSTTEVTTSVESGPFNSIWGMAAAADNVLYVRDRYSASIQRVLKVYTA